MIRNIRIWLWGIVAELEYRLYPWSTRDVPQWAVERYNLNNSAHEMEYDDQLNFEWLKCHDEKIVRLQSEMVNVLDRVGKLEKPNV